MVLSIFLPLPSVPPPHRPVGGLHTEPEETITVPLTALFAPALIHSGRLHLCLRRETALTLNLIAALSAEREELW